MFLRFVIKIFNNISYYIAVMLGVVRFLCFAIGIDFFYLGRSVFLEWGIFDFRGASVVMTFLFD